MGAGPSVRARLAGARVREMPAAAARRWHDWGHLPLAGEHARAEREGGG